MRTIIYSIHFVTFVNKISLFVINYLINLFFPKVCDGCRAILLQNEIVFCTSCRHEMPLTQYHLDPKNEAMKKFYGKHLSKYMQDTVPIANQGGIYEKP
jgi:hypothetical protein